VVIRKDKTYKIGYQVSLKFSMGQHSRDQQLLQNFISYLGCGRLSIKANLVEFVVDKFSDINEKIIPFLINILYKVLNL